MGVSMNACVLPGNAISDDRLEGVGYTTFTDGMAEAAVSFARECSEPRRAITPKTTTPATMAPTTVIPIHVPQLSLGSSCGMSGSEGNSLDGWVSVAFFSAVLAIRAPSILM